MQNIKTFFRMFSQLKEILNTKEKQKASIIAFLSILSAILETLGVGVILPFIIAMLQPETLFEYDRLNSVFKMIHIENTSQIVLLMGIGVVCVYVLKNTFILSFNRYRLFFRNDLERDLSIKMLKAYINRPYSFFLNANSSEIMRGISGDNSAVATVVDNYCTLFNEGLTCVMLGIMLILINPFMALGIMGLAGIIVLTIVISFRKKISSYSAKARDAFGDRYRYSYEAVNGIKEIDVMKRQSRFLERFVEAATVAADNNTRYLWVAMLPSRLIETVFIVGLVIIVVVAYAFSKNISLIAAQLSALGVAAIRILPSISNISGAVNSLVFQRPALENAYDNLVKEKIKTTDISKKENNKADTKSNRSEFINSIVIDDISWKYSDGLPDVIHGLSMTINRGEAVGIIGESGAGKTTLADLILGLFRPQTGSITVDECSIYDERTQWHLMVGYVPQSVFLLDDTIRNNILFGIDIKDADEERLRKTIEQAQLSEFVSKQPDGLDTILGERGIKISGGQRQRIAIARALYYNPDILVLDEATSALDNDTEAAVIEAINALQGEKTLIIVAHRLTTIEKCDKVYEIKDGKAERVR